MDFLKNPAGKELQMEERRENPLGVVPINRLLVTMSLPIMLSMLIQALYNVVDSIFVVRVSDAALTAVSLAFPAQNLMIAVSVGTAVGVNSLMSRRLGEKNYRDASLAATNGMFLALLGTIAFAIFGIFGVHAFYCAFTDDPELIRMGSEYLSVVCVASFGVFFSIMGERLVQVTGSSIYTMLSQMTGAIVNIILDPILIFGLCGFPRMEVKGAAIATVIGQIAGMIVIFVCNHRFNHEVRLDFRGFRPDGRIIVDIYRVGLPSILMQAIGSVMTFAMNKILIAFTEIAVNVFGIYFKLQSFIFLPIFGLNNGMVPIIGYNFGARCKERIFAAVRLAMYIAVSVMVVGTLVFQLLPEPILRVLFDASDEMVAVGVPALRTISVSFIPAAVSIVLSGAFQALGKGVNSMIMSFCRQLIVLLPAAYLLGRFVSLHALWWSFPIAEFVAVSMAIVMFWQLYRDKLRDL